MSHDNQRPSGHDSDGGDDFTTEEHGVSHDTPGVGDPYANVERQGWEHQPTTLNDDFGDPEAADEQTSAEDDDAAPAKSRGGLMLPLLLCVLVLGAGGFAYWQLVMKPGEAASPQRQAEALAPASDGGQHQAAIALPTSTPPTPPADVSAMPGAVVSPTAVPTQEAVVAQGALASAQVPGVNLPLPTTEVASAVIPAPVPASGTLAPATLPSPPAPDAAMPSMTPQETAAKLPVPTNNTDIVLPIETPSITLNQKPPVVEMPSVPSVAVVPVGTDSKSAKKALESDVVDLKKTVTDLNDKLQKMKAEAARQDAALLQAQAALKAAQAVTKASAEMPVSIVVVPKTHDKAKHQSHATAHKTVVASKKKTDVKKHAVATVSTKKTAVKQGTANKAKPDRWVLRSVASGSAWISSSAAENDLKEVHVGDVVPGVGTIKSIASRDGHWVVQGSVKTLE